MIRFLALGLFGILTGAVNSAFADQCDLNQKEIVFSYAPNICVGSSCKTTQKLQFLGQEVYAYFQSGVIQSMRSMGTSPPGEAASTGFIYPIGGVTDVLSDPKQQVALQQAVRQLSPGARYERYTIGATWDGETMKLEDHADAQLPYVGKITNEVSTQIYVSSCSSCEARILLTTIIGSGSRNTMELGAGECSVSGVQ